MSSGPGDACLAGLVLDTGDASCFVPADVVVQVVPTPRIAHIAGLVAPAEGVAIVEERPVTAIRIGCIHTTDMVVCEIPGGQVGLVGARVVAAGTFEPAVAPAGAVEWGDSIAVRLDVKHLVDRTETAIWRARSSRDDGRGL